MRRIAVLLALALLARGAAAQDRFGTLDRDILRRMETPRAAPATARDPLLAPQPTPAQQAIDVIHYDVDIAFNHTTLLVEGRVTALVEAGADPAALIELNADPVLAILAAEIDGWGPAAFTRAGDVVSFELPEPLPAGERAMLSVWFEGSPAGAAHPGLFFRFDGGTRPVIYSLSEPWGARTWWPCKDYPDDKATFEIALSVQEPMLAASNGHYLGVSDTTRWGEPFRRYRWRTQYPMSPYLFSISAAEYVVLTDHFVHAPGETMQIVNYVYPRHVDAALEDLSIAVPALEFFSSLFGLYPFIDEKYGVAICKIGGAMEHQTLTSYGDILIRGDHAYDWIYIHELAHQWFGNLVTCSDWTHIWLNEGWASYSEALWFEHLGGPEDLRAYMQTHDNPSRWSGPILRDPDNDNPWYYFNAVVYSKAAWVLHMLRRVMGDDLFFDTARAYLADPQFRFGAADTDGFIDFFAGHYGGDLRWFFDPWLTRTDRLRYDWDWTCWEAEGSQRLSLSVRQAVDEPYTMPVDFRITTVAGTIDTVLWVAGAVESFLLLPGAAVLDVALDPERWILCDAARVPTSAPAVPAATFLAQNRPNPFNPSTTIRFGLAAVGPVNLRIYDQRGALVTVLLEGRAGAGLHEIVWDGTNTAGLPVASGVYFCRLEAGTAALSRKLILLR